MKKIITLFATLFLLSIFAVTSFAADEFKTIKNFGENSTEAFYKYRDSIVEVVFTDSVDSQKAAEEWNVGETTNMGITAWIKKNNDESKKASEDRYNLYIGAEGGFYANSDMSYFFKNFVNLKKITGFENVNTTGVTNVEGIFSGCLKLYDIGLTTWDTSKVVNMNRMFYNCKALYEIDLSSFKTDSLVSMHEMFAECNSLKNIYVSNTWKLREDIIGDKTFYNCTNILSEISYDKNKVSCKYATVNDYLSAKKIKSFNEDTKEAFYKYRDSIVEVKFADSLEGSNVDLCWNVGKVPSTNVIAWLEKNVEASAATSGDRYNLYIGSIGGFYANGNMSYFFKNFVNLKKITGFENVNTEFLTNVEGIFSGCSSLESIDLTSWNTSKVVTMSRMFYQCKELKELDLSSFSTESLTSLHYMFADCIKLKTIFVGDSWKLREDVTGFNTFLNCKELSGNVDYNEKNVNCNYATVYGYMVKKLPEDYDPDAKPDEKFDKTIKSYGPGDETDFHAYKDSIVSVTFLDSIDFISLGGSIENWDVSTKEDGSVKAWIRYVVGGYDLYIAAEGGVNANPESGYMFYGYKNLKEVNGLQNFRTSQATDMKYMFYGCEALESIDISSFDTENVTDMSYMFGFCSKLRTADLGTIDTRKVSNMGNLFYYCTSLEEVDLSGVDFTALTAAPVIFVDCPVKKIVADNVVLSDKATGIFKSTQNGVSTVEEISLAGADTKNVTDMSRMFENSSALISLDLSSFDLSKVKNMSYMFNGCSALESVIFGETEALNVSDMSYMFKDCRKLKTAEFGGVSVGSIKDMSYMFTGCISLQRLNFGKFNTGLLQSLEHTFRGCMNLERIYVGEKWSIKAVASGNSTFAGCEKLVGSVSYAAIGDTSYKAATLNGYLTPVDPSVKIPPVEEEEKKEDNTETEPEKLNFFQRIIQWFKNLFARFFGK